MRDDDFPHPLSDTEAEGLPGVADDDSYADEDEDSSRAADGPSPAALPGDEPDELDRLGSLTVPTDPLAMRLWEEEPDDTDDTDDQLTRDVTEPGPQNHPDSEVSLYDRPGLADDTGKIGRLVAPNDGGGLDDEADEIAFDAGSAGGGPTAEEGALHPDDEGWDPDGTDA